MIKKVFKKLISLMLILSFLFGLASCSTPQGTKSYEIVGTVIDGAGREVGIRSDAAETTAASVYFVAAPFFVALGMTDRVLAVNARTAFWTKADAGLGAAGTVGKGTVDLEKLAEYAPSVLVHRSNDPDTIKAVEKLGIDTICITVENIEDVKSTLTLLGKYFGVDDRADTAIKWLDEKFAYVQEIVAKIPQSERKTALLMGGSLGRIAGNDMMQTWMIEQAGGIPVADTGLNHNWIDVGLEKVFSYNPDVIFCTSSAALDYTVDELYADPAWSAMTAIKNKTVFQVPAYQDSWDMPGLSCVIGVMYMLHEMYPQYFSVEDLEDQVDDYYRFMFGKCFDEELHLDWDNFDKQ